VIARVWTGVVASDRVQAYVAYVEETGLEGYRRTLGCRLASTLTRELGGERAEVVAFSIWEDVTDIQRFSGSDIDAMVLYPEDEAYLLEPPTLRHHDVHSFATPTREERP